jgi:hypothetical protein
MFILFSACFGQPCAHHHSFHLVVCLTTGPKPLPKRALHIVRSRASSFKWKYLLLSLWSSNSFLRLLSCLPVTSIPPCIFPSITRCRRQFLRKMWPIQFASVYVFHVGYSSAPWLLSNTTSFLTWSVQMISVQVWMRLQSHSNLHTKRSSIQSDIPDVLIQLILLMMGTWLPETCREWK